MSRFMRSGRCALGIALVQLAVAPAAVASTAAERGKIFVQQNCARCHAVGPTGSSPYAPAPPFRTLHERYDVGNLAEAFAEGIMVFHEGGGPQMPHFMLQPDQIGDLIAYLRSVQSKTPARAHAAR
jgi:mono/diheme cytochrome c family protein